MPPLAEHSAYYRREVDGLRAVAILPVLLYHAGFAWISGGYVGVDVFFVISGYLITSIILREVEEQRFSMLRFYERRARRILPALFFMLVVCTVVAWAWMLPDELRRFGQSLSAVQLFSSNIYFWQTTNYFSPAAEELPLLHTWSLAVEEQYYLLFPLLIMLGHHQGRRVLLALTLALALCSLALAEWGARNSAVANFYLLPTRAWELLAGSLLAFAAPGLLRALADRRLLAELGSLAGLALILISMFVFDISTPFPGLYATVPVMGCVLILALTTPNTVVGKLLSSRLAVGIGLVSYSAYLWHQPIIVFARYTAADVGSPWVKAGLAAAALIAAAFSWRFVEQPFRDRRLLGSRRSLFTASAIGILVLGGAGLALELGKGYSARGDSATLRASVNEFATLDNGWCFYSVDSMPALALGAAGTGCLIGDLGAPLQGLLVGDSHAGQFEPFWDALGKQLGTGLEAVTTNWCFPSFEERYTGPATSRAKEQCQFNRQYVEQNLKRFDFVVVAADWRNLLKQGMIDDALAFIARAAGNGQLVIVMPTPKRFDRDAFTRMQRARFFGEAIDLTSVSSSDDLLAVEANEKVRTFTEKTERTLFLSREEVFQVNGVASDLTADNMVYSADGRHISVHGSLAAAEQFLRSRGLVRVRAAIGATIH